MAKIKLNAFQQGIIEDASKLTNGEYKEVDSLDDIFLIITDLIETINYDRTKNIEYEQYVNDNFERIPPHRMYGINESDFH